MKGKASLLGISSLVIAVSLTSCGKKEEPAATVTTPEVAPATSAQPVSQPQPVAAAPVPAGGGTLEQAQEALKAKDYEKATAVLLTVKVNPQNEAQSAAVRTEMTRLQSELSAAALRGDPKAKAAIELLRRQSSH